MARHASRQAAFHLRVRDRRRGDDRLAVARYATLSCGKPQEDGLIVAEAHQEHGLVACEGAGAGLESRYPVGTRVRVLPNHACLIAAPYDRYHLVRGSDPRVEGIWPKVTGWSAGE